LFFFAIESIGARRKENSVAQLVGALLCRVRHERKKRAAQIAQNESECRCRSVSVFGFNRPLRNERPATHPAVEDSFADESGERFVDGHHRDAVGEGHLAVGLELGSNRHFAGCDFSANVECDLLIQGRMCGGIDCQAVSGGTIDREILTWTY
jgi:hypothetical protein